MKTKEKTQARATPNRQATIKASDFAFFRECRWNYEMLLGRRLTNSQVFSLILAEYRKHNPYGPRG